METYKIRRFNVCGKWIELWLDGMDYYSEEIIWDEETNTSIKTGDKAYNFCMKTGTLLHNLFEDTGETVSIGYNESELIGLDVYLEVDNLRFIPLQNN